LHEISNDNGVRVANLPHPKIWLSKVQCSHIVTFIHLLGHLLMERLKIKLTIFWDIGDVIQVYLMSDRLGEQFVILTTNMLWQKLGRDWQWVNKQCTNFIWRSSISRSQTTQRVNSNIGWNLKLLHSFEKLRRWCGY
jgi:hypothetical protein